MEAATGAVKVATAADFLVGSRAGLGAVWWACEGGRRKENEHGPRRFEAGGVRVYLPSDGWPGLGKDGAVHGWGCRVCCRRRCRRRFVLGGGLGSAGWTQAALGWLASLGPCVCGVCASTRGVVVVVGFS